MKYETLERPSLSVPPKQALAKLALLTASFERSIDHAPDGIVRSIRPGEAISTPPEFGFGTQHALPSIEIETYRGNKALLVPFYATLSVLSRLYRDSARGRERRVERMTYEMAVRMLDTTGAEGLHHMHRTILPQTIYYNVRPSGLQVYMTPIGEVRRKGEAPKRVLGIVSATASAKDELDLLRNIGGQRMKGRRR